MASGQTLLVNLWRRNAVSAVHKATLKASFEQVASLVALADQKALRVKSDVDVPKHIQVCVESVHSLRGSDLQPLTCSLAKLRWRDEKGWKDIAEAVTERVQETHIADLIQIAGSFSVARQYHHNMLRAISSKAKESPGRLTCWSWAGFIFSLQKAGIEDAELLNVAADVMLIDPYALKTLKTACIIAFVEASLGSGKLHQGIFKRLSDVIAERMQSLNKYDLSRVVWTWGKATCTDNVFVQSLCGALRCNLSEFPRSRISFTIHGLSLLGCRDKTLLVDLASAWTCRGPWKPQEISCIISALSKCGFLNTHLCNHIASCCLPMVPHLNPRALATVMLACSEADCTHVEFLQQLGNAASQQLSKASVKELCTLAVAAAKLSLAPACGSAISGAIVEHVSEIKGSQLALMMHAISRLSDDPGKFLPTLEHATLQHVRLLTQVDLRYIAMSWAKTCKADPCLMNAVASRVVDVIGTVDPSTLSHVAWGYHRLQASNPKLFAVLGARGADTMASFTTLQLGHTAFAFVQANVHDNVLLDSIAKEALTRLRSMSPYSTSLLLRAFIKANLESAAVTALLENLAIRARCHGWTQLCNSSVVELSDLQKQYVETVQEVLPCVLVNQRHQMGLIMGMALVQDDGSIVNLEVDPEEVVLSNLELTVRARRDDFLENVGIEVLRLKVKNLDDLKYHLQEIFGSLRPSVNRSASEAEVVRDDQQVCNGCKDSQEDLELQDFEIPREHLWKEIEPATLHSQSSV